MYRYTEMFHKLTELSDYLFHRMFHKLSDNSNNSKFVNLSQSNNVLKETF